MPSFFDLYFKYVEETEPPIIFHRWSIIPVISAMLGRQVWLPFGQFRIFPNMYCMLIGDPGSRKSTAIKMAVKLCRAAGYDQFSGNKTSKEKFLLDLEGATAEDGTVTATAVMENIFGDGGVGTEPKEVFIASDEFINFMPRGDLDFMSILGEFWDWDDDDKPWTQRLKNSKSVAIFQPTVNMLGGTTHENFSLTFPPETLGAGFISRMVLVYGERSGKMIDWPVTPSEKGRTELITILEKMKAEVHGPVTVSQRARDVLGVIYRTHKGVDDARFAHYSTRRHTHLLKLCILCAACRLSTELLIDDVILANSILSYAEHFMPKALGEFGKAKNGDVANRILSFLANSIRPVDQVELWKHCQSDLDRPEDLQRLLDALNQSKKIQWVKKTSSGVQGWTIVRKALSNQQVYVDYNLLKEADHVKI